MNVEEVLENVATLPSEDWVKIQSGIAEMLAARFSSVEIGEIGEALGEADEEFARGEGLSSEEMRKRLKVE